MNTYLFKITLVGIGEDKNDAWGDALEGFILSSGTIPSDENIKLIEKES
jgi:hypothetical protein